ncbi:histone deacetylase [Methanosalsum zhilinae]|uniref:histone deacetylase n=1 Tax=Methanosalsum zhilinae TaxID=39669 RepID=UPI000A009AA8|nr:histone deacetylase [Methanosalsum zhilinae]
MANERDLLRVHTSSYVDFIRSYASKGGGFLGDSTYITPQSYEIARMAAGGAIKAAELVIDENYLCSFALIRPPGHHAGSDKYSGFCLFNNAAVLARYLQQVKGLNKILILDWDAHAGNGTMDIFYSDPTVMTVSIHREPADYYPRTGFTGQTGEGAGKGFTANIEMPQGSGDEEYIMAFEEVIMPLINRFSPDFVICCCGFDGYYQEKNNKLKLTAEGYYQIGRILRNDLAVDFVLLLEGGYHRFNGQLCHSILSSLLGRKNPIDETDIFSRYELGIQKKIYQKAQKNIADVKELFSIK